MSTQIYASLKRSSKYYHQQRDHKTPFPVTFRWDGYCVCGNNNFYRIADVNLFAHVEGQFLKLGGRR